MTGWVSLAVVGVAAAGLLAILRVPRLLWSLVASFLMLGAAGYAWQGRPTAHAHPVVADGVKVPQDTAYLQLRDTMFGRFGGESIYFGISDRMLGDGKIELAASVLEGAVDYAPRNPAFWTEYANVIALHDQDYVSPAALFAYRQAMRVAPDHPGPPFFLGWAYLRAGQPVETRIQWARALALTQPTAPFRAAIADQLAQLDGYLSQAGAR